MAVLLGVGALAMLIPRSPSEVLCPWIRENYRCATENYTAHLLSLPSLDPGALRIGPGVRLLLYGTSYMRQLFQSIVCNNPRGFEVYHFQGNGLGHRLRAPSCVRGRKDLASARFGIPSCVPADITDKDVLELVFADGASVTGVFNSRALQDTGKPSALYRTLRAFALRGHFTHVAALQPHPACFFQWMRNRALPKCVNLNSTHTNLRDLFSCSALANIMACFSGKVVLAYSWAITDDSQTCSVPGAQVVRLAEAIGPGQWCKSTQCLDARNGHQCQPGTVESMLALLLGPKGLGINRAPPGT